MTRKVFERDFLKRLAPVWLACRARVWGHQLGPGWPPLNLEYDLLGMVDYKIGMQLLCQEVRDQLTAALAKCPAEKP